jgi:tRNA(Ile)-lysidine synthase
MTTLPRHRFERSVLATARRRGLFSPRSRVVAAVSGGPDSTALLAVLAALRDAGAIAALGACHVDHRLRAGSADDAEFCSALCARFGVPLERAEVSVAAGNVQAAARRARYAALRRAAARAGADRLATGHTRSDQAETVLMRLLRGSGARGLAAIPPRRGAVVRPLIDCSRADVLAYLRDLGCPFREDPTNASPRYLRNRLRSELMPAIERLAPGAGERLARAADLLRSDDRALERLAARLAPSGATSVALDLLRGAPPAVGRRAVRRLWRAETGSRRGLALPHVDAILRLARRQSPWRLSLPGGREVRAAYGQLSVGRSAAPGEPLAPVEIPGPGAYPLPGRGVLEVTCDGGVPRWPLVARGRRPGDRFAPERGAGAKKLKSWLIDRKVPRASRDGLVVLADGGGEVVYVVELGARGAGAGGLSARIVPERTPEAR